MAKMVTDRYILIGQTPVPCEDLLEWAIWLEHADRRVAYTKILGICYVSTVFLGLDHGCGGRGPVLYEAMTFWSAGGGGEEQERCSTWKEAERMHARMVARASRPGAVAAFVRRVLRTFMEGARDDWRERWREIRGLGPRYGDAATEEAMRHMKERLAERASQEWKVFG